MSTAIAVAEAVPLRQGGRFSEVIIRPRPVQFETPYSYLDRLCAANVVDANWVRILVRSRRHYLGDPTQLGHVIEELGGPSIEHWQEEYAVALRGTETSKGAFDRPRSTRVACLSCTAGTPIPTYMHQRFGFCLKHGRWTDPEGGVVQPLHHCTPEQVVAERCARRLVASGAVGPGLYETAWSLTRDWAYLSGSWPARLSAARRLPDYDRRIHDRMALYPETVAVMRLVSSDRFRRLFAIGAKGAIYRKAHLARRLFWAGMHSWVFTEGIESRIPKRPMGSAMIPDSLR